jgi:hypothetical protein
MDGFNGGDDAIRCARPGQFASVTPRKGKTQRRTGHGARSHSKNAMLENIPFPRLMKNFLRILALVVFAVPGIAFSGDFKSEVIAGGQPVDLPHVGGDQFMLIRNFTQEGGTDRGFVTVNHNVNVLTAAILTNDPTQGTEEVINTVIIAGPADVTVTCGTTTGNCFITFKKESN